MFVVSLNIWHIGFLLQVAIKIQKTVVHFKRHITNEILTTGAALNKSDFNGIDQYYVVRQLC